MMLMPVVRGVYVFIRLATHGAEMDLVDTEAFERFETLCDSAARERQQGDITIGGYG